MPIPGNMRGIVDMNIAIVMLALTYVLMKLTLRTIPLTEAMAVRGLMAALIILAVGRVGGGLRLRVGRADRRVLAVRTAAEIVCIPPAGAV